MLPSIVLRRYRTISSLVFLALLWGPVTADVPIVRGEPAAVSRSDEPGRSYFVLVSCESDDEVAVVRLDVPSGEQKKPSAKLIERVTVGVWAIEMEGPHGITVSPDGKHWYLSMAHGRPFGRVYKYTTGDNRLLGHVELGLFPATMQVSPATGLLYVVNFNLHGDAVPSTVSVVDPEEMIEVARITTGVMPHGSRHSPDGLRHYSVAMMSHELFEIDAVALDVRRRLKLDTQVPGRMPKPTWVQLHPTRPLAYVVCSGSDEVLEVELNAWKIVRRFATPPGPYNVEVTPDGAKLVVTYKSDASTGFWDLAGGSQLARLPNSRKVSHGIAITPDSRYALVSVEGKGRQPGAVDVFDLTTLKRIATVEVGKQAGGIAFWKMTARE